MADDLVAFLRARLAEDEQIALDFDKSAPAPWSLSDGPGGCILDKNGWRVVGDGYYDQPHELRHYHRFSPARVLADVDAKRRILDAVEGYLNPHPGQECWRYADNDPCELHVAAHQTRTLIDPGVLRFLAAPYAAHPDFRPEWAVERPEEQT